MPQEIPTTSWREPALLEVDADFDLVVEKMPTLTLSSRSRGTASKEHAFG
jgi:hypothetical protein